MEIKLDKGMIAIIDDEDFEKINLPICGKWYARHDKKYDIYYASCGTKLLKPRKLLNMHRLILGAKKGEMVDHQDHNGLNNSKINIRICTDSQNQRNRTSKRNSSSKYLGVSLTKEGCFKSHIRIKGVYFYLGTHKDEVNAAIAYDKAAVKHYGEFANPNFKNMIMPCIICNVPVVVIGSPEIVCCSNENCTKIVENNIGLDYQSEGVVLSRHVIYRNDFHSLPRTGYED